MACALALTGFIIMLGERELEVYGTVGRSSLTSILMKSVVSLTTILLVILILIYHKLDIQLYIFDRSIKVRHLQP